MEEEKNNLVLEKNYVFKKYIYTKFIRRDCKLKTTNHCNECYV